MLTSLLMCFYTIIHFFHSFRLQVIQNCLFLLQINCYCTQYLFDKINSPLLLIQKMQTSIKSISQLHNQMVEKKNAVLKQIKQMSIPSLSYSQDLQNRNITIDKIFAKIPEEQRLKQIVELQNESPINHLQYYKGDYEIVKKAAQRTEYIKPQASEIYSLFSQLNLPKVHQKFKLAKQKNSIKLESYEIQSKETISRPEKYYEDRNQEKEWFSTYKSESIKAIKFERNTISEDYLHSVKESQKYEEVLPQNQHMKNDDLLVHVCIYDPLNGQKQHEIVFLGDMKLIDLKKQIYCKIQKLSQAEQAQKTQNKSNLHEQKSFFVIEQNIYYQGTHQSQQQIDSLIKNIKHSYQTDLHKFSMNQTEIKNLRVVFGRPYLYRHINGCDHMIVFKDIRLYSKNGTDPDIKKKYPFVVFESKMKKKKCEGCDISFAVLACVGDKLKNGQTSYLCRECHENIHNDLTNPKNKFMKVIPYLHE